MKEDPKHIRISEFNYPLPDERIAKFPLPVRDQSKLLLYRHGEVTEDIFTSLPDYLPANSLIISIIPKLFRRVCTSIKKRERLSKYSVSNRSNPTTMPSTSSKRSMPHGSA